MNMVAPNKNEDGICDVRTAPKHMTVTRIPRGSKARVLHH